MKLRAYQQKALDAVFHEWSTGKTRTLLVQATGTGKTIVFAQVAKRIADKGKRVLILAHRGELLGQARDKIKTTTGYDCALEKAESTAADTDALIVVASVQTMTREKRMQAYAQDAFSAIIIDEAHHAAAESYTRILDYFSSAYVLGVTATADRADKKSLSHVFQSVAYEYLLNDAIHDGYLARIEAQSIPLKIDIEHVSLSNGDYAAGELGDALEPYLEGIADTMQTVCEKRKTVVFLPLIATSRKFCALLQERGLRACEVNGETENRAEILRKFEDGTYNVICNSMLLTEGWDAPAVDCIVVLRATKSRALYVQMVGRGTRLAPNKDKLLLLDFLWMTGTHELVRPTALFAKDESVAKKAQQKLEETDGALDLEDATQDAESEVQKEREEALARKLEELRYRKARLVDPLQYEMSICDIDLQTYEPTFTWEFEGASDKQKEELARAGIDASTLSAGKASQLIDRIYKRRALGLATPKQVRMLEKKGFNHAGTWTFDEASAMMSRLAANNWRIPRGINPATYEPHARKKTTA